MSKDPTFDVRRRMSVKTQELLTAKAQRTRRKKRKGWSIFHLPGKRQMKRHPWQKPLSGFAKIYPAFPLRTLRLERVREQLALHLSWLDMVKKWQT
jgi:hypothetical protein